MLSLLTLAPEGGFNPLEPTHVGIALWTWIILLIAIPFIWKAVMGPITKALEERDHKVTSAIESAQKASAEAQRAQVEIEKKLVEARGEASRLVAEARARGEQRERELVDLAQRKAKELEESARRTIEAERDKALAAIREEVVELTMNAASRVIQRNVGSEDDKRMVRELVLQKR